MNFGMNVYRYIVYIFACIYIVHAAMYNKRLSIPAVTAPPTICRTTLHRRRSAQQQHWLRHLHTLPTSTPA